MHVCGGFLGKVHYNALFGSGKRQEKAFNAEAQRKDLREEERDREAGR
jgi:hypothetical protein